jgi:hypothetical protein
MRHFIINDRNIILNNKGNNKAEFEIISAEKGIDLAVKDKYVLLNNKPDETSKFTSDGEIEAITSAKEVPLTNEELEKNKQLRLERKPLLPKKYSRFITLNIQEILEGNNYFDDYVYSLLSVTDFSKPLVHFKQKTRIISATDFDTIVESKVYVARTAFGKLVNSLPKENKFEFSLYVMKRFNTTNFKKINYVDLLDFLMDYIEKHVLSMGDLLVETNGMIKNQLLDTGINYQEVGFIDEESQKFNLLNVQAERFSVLFSLENEIELIKRIRENIKMNGETENKFEELFKNHQWPLNLN